MTIYSLRQAARYSMRRPGFTTAAILILAVGIGLNAVVFSAISAVLLRPLPFAGAERVTFVWETGADGATRSVSFPKLLDWTRLADSFDHISGFANPTYTLSSADTVERVDGELVSAAYFPMLGVSAALGRTFEKVEGEQASAARVVVLSDAIWHRRYAADPSIVGKTVTVNGAEVQVVGVAPKGFRGISGSAQIWMPLGAQSLAVPELDDLDPMHRRDVRWLAVLGRLTAGVTPEQATAEMNNLQHELASLEPAADADGKISLVPLRRQLFGDLRIPLMLLQGAVVLVLLVACANLTNLLLGRLVARERELSVRLALGATRRRLTGQLAAESMVLALLGAGVGLLLAIGAIQGLDRVLADQLPNYVSIRLDPSVLWFTLLCTAACVLLITAVSAWRCSRPALAPSLAEAGASVSESRGSRRTRRVLVVAEIALSVALLLNAALMESGFRRSQEIDPGFAVDGRMTFRVDLPAGRYDKLDLEPFAGRLLARVRALPEASGAVISSDLPFGDRESAAHLLVEGAQRKPDDPGIRVYQHSVGTGYFASLEIPILRGRGFLPTDRDGAPPVAVVSSTAARTMWPDDDPIGRRFRIGTSAHTPWVQVVGVVHDVRYRNLLTSEQGAPDIFLPFAQAPSRSFAVIVQTTVDPESSLPTLRQTVRTLDPEIPIYSISTLHHHILDSVSQLQLASTLMGVFGFAALLLASFGLYSVVSYSTHQRQREMGIRMAFGADGPAVVRLVVRSGIAITLAGMVVGSLLGLLIARAITGSLPGVGGIGPGVIAMTLLPLAVTSLAAAYLPARRASKSDPAAVLRGT